MEIRHRLLPHEAEIQGRDILGRQRRGSEGNGHGEDTRCFHKHRPPDSGAKDADVSLGWRVDTTGSSHRTKVDGARYLTTLEVLGR
jgi:hypothetical protein